MKKTILTLILFITTLSVTFAQETQSDATWEETIEFLNSKKEYMKLSNYDNTVTETIEFNNNTIIRTKITIRREQDFATRRIQTCSLKYLEEAYETSKADIALHFTGDYVENKTYFASGFGFGKYDPKYRYDSSLKTYTIVVEGLTDREMKPRILKAFQHLAYLATQKREAERKASGDKF